MGLFTSFQEANAQSVYSTVQGYLKKDGLTHVLLVNSFSKFVNQTMSLDDKYTTQIDYIVTQMQRDGYEILDVKMNSLADQGLFGIMEGFHTLITYRAAERQPSVEKPPISYQAQRPSIEETHTSDNHILRSWSCVNCGLSNNNASNFCTNCGSKRSLPWKCSSCDSENDAITKFCPICGKAKEDSEEIVAPEVSRYSDTMLLIDAANEQKSAKDVLSYFKKVFDNDSDPDILYFLKVLQKNAEVERMYGNSKESTMKTVTAFLKHGMKYFAVDRSNFEFACPNCGTKQRSDRSMCYDCGVLFRDLE